MPFPEDLLNPIGRTNPSGVNLRYEPILRQDQEARREEDSLRRAWPSVTGKVADNSLVIKLTKDVLSE